MKCIQQFKCVQHFTFAISVTNILKWLSILLVAIFSENVAYADSESKDVSQNSDKPGWVSSGKNWNRCATETLRLNEDSTFEWQAVVDYRWPDGQYRPSGEGTYSIIGDTIILNSNEKKVLDIKYDKEKRYNKNKRKIILRETKKSNILMEVGVYVIYIKENGDTVYANNFINPEESWSMRTTELTKIVELDHPIEIVDIMVVQAPLALRPLDMYEINQNKGDIEISIDLMEPRNKRYFDNEKWTISEDTIFTLTQEGYPSVYPLVLKDSVYISTRNSYGKPYDGEYYARKLSNGERLGDFGYDDDDVLYNYKYPKQAIANGFKSYGIIFKKKCYDANDNLVAEGEYLSDTNNPFLRWYRYIKVGRWKYYEPDGTVRYVDY